MPKARGWNAVDRRRFGIGSAAGAAMKLVSGLVPRRHSIGVNIFGAFIALGLMTVIIGGYGIYVLRAAGSIVDETYDGPLMEINFARAASLDFTRMDNQALRRKIVPEAERAEVDRKTDELSQTFYDDLDVAAQRSLGARETALISEIQEAVTRWNVLRKGQQTPEDDAEIIKTSDRVIADFDTLIELTADESFIQRRKAISAISHFRYASIALSGAAVLVGVIITLLLARGIIRPLTAAAKVADRIADGHLQTPIPIGGKDETGMLLRSMTVMQSNISEMMEREVAQRRSAQSRLIDAVESSREGMVLVDAAGKIVIANRQLADFFPTVVPYVVNGMSFAATFKQMQSVLAWHGELDDSAGSVLAASQIGTPFSVGEYQLLDGRWLRISRSNTREGGFFLFLSDFTEIKVREERFREAMLQAETANVAKSHFLTNMSHELRTPLNAIIGFSEMIASEVFGSVGNPKYLDYIGNVLESGRHLLQIINSVLDMAKNETGKLELRAEPLDLRDVLRECTKMMREQCERAKLRLDVPPLEQPLPVHGEPAKLRQIVLNLLSNAMKFNAPGGSVSVIAGRGSAGMTEFRIVDTGIGMSRGDIAVALTPFGQVDSKLARRYEGTGLGLPLTKVLVELHGGTMVIDSEPGRGTSVTVALPRPA
jgi:signal transduction histidine kinase/HAMP domain-containing protein